MSAKYTGPAKLRLATRVISANKPFIVLNSFFGEHVEYDTFEEAETFRSGPIRMNPINEVHEWKDGKWVLSAGSVR